MIWFRSLAFAIIFYAGTIVTVLSALPAAIRGGPAVRRYAVRWARYHRWCARHILGIESHIEGDVPRATMLFAAKHQSMYETLELLLILDEPGMVVKRELADLPFWGRVAKSYGVIPVDRAGSATALRAMTRTARGIAAENRAIAIFPEGTRVPPGERPPLRPGFAGLYRALGLPVVPIAIDSGRIYPRKGFLKRPGIITFRFDPAIPPGLPRREVEARVHTAINALED